jgi:DMSO/TMAO reductase YedYZ molybdopterin-dependent catalytic subunit
MVSLDERRRVLRMLAAGGVGIAAAGCGRGSAGAGAGAGKFQGKAADLVLHTERPPNLEMPMRYLAHDLTPNDAMFVRWHLSNLPTAVDEATWKLRVAGHVEQPLELSLRDLRERFALAHVVAVNQCTGNGRSFFGPRVPGVQWGRGAVGNAKWTGVRLADVIAAAKPKAGAAEAVFRGMDRAPIDSVARFEKSLAMADVPGAILAWGMNEAPLPMLNGYPLRLVVPGWYSTYWVKALESVTVLDHAFDGYWMKKAYRLPDDPDANEAPGALAKDTVPVKKMNVRSLFARPQPGEKITREVLYDVQGVAWDGGSGVARVEVSTDGGATWNDARLEQDLGPSSWRRWRAVWMPKDAGKATLVARCTSVRGERQEAKPRWNRGGYLKNDPERIDVEVT